MEHASLTARWVAGPDAGGSSLLRPGQQLVGRHHRADVRCDDPVLWPRHAVLDVGRGGVTVRPFPGGGPVRIAGRPLDTPTPINHGEWIEVGHSALVVDALEDEPRTRMCSGLLPGAASGVGAGAASIRLQQPTLALAGAIGVAATLLGWTMQRSMERRAGRLLTLGFTTMADTTRVPVRITVRPGARIGITGPQAMPVARSLVLQAAGMRTALHVTTNDRPEWDWCAALGVKGPNAMGDRHATLFVGDQALSNGAHDGRASLIITDDSPIARWLPHPRGRSGASRGERLVRLIGVGEAAAYRRAVTVDLANSCRTPEKGVR